MDRVLRRLHGSRLLKALGSLRKPISGIGIEMHQLYDYEHYPLANHYLDLFVDPGSEFGTHSVGFQPKEYERARSDFLEIRRSQKSAIWEHFYSQTRPAFCVQLCRLLGLDEAQDGVGFGLGSSVTEVLSRLVASLREVGHVVLAEDDFVTLQRAAAILGRSGVAVQCIPVNELKEHVLQLPLWQDEKKDHETVRHLVLVSLVNSCTQKVMQLDWVLSVPMNVVVVIDITQAVANLPLHLAALAVRPNIFLIGSLIKVRFAECLFPSHRVFVLSFGHSSMSLYGAARSVWRRTWLYDLLSSE